VAEGPRNAIKALDCRRNGIREIERERERERETRTPARNAPRYPSFVSM